MRRTWPRRVELMSTSWTQRFTWATLSALLFGAVQLNWFGMVPGASDSLLAQVALLTVIGVVALLVSPLGMALGLAVAFVVIFVNQATAGIGIAPLRFAPPPEFWTVSLPRIALTWAAFPLLTALLARLLPQLAAGMAVGAALLTLPFIRYDPSSELVQSILSPSAGRFVVLAVPWLPLVGLTALVTSGALVLYRFRPRALVAAAMALSALTLALPLSANVVRETQLTHGVVLEPRAGGPLTNVFVGANAAEPVTPILNWDGQRVVVNDALLPLRTGVTTRAALRFLPVVAEDFSAGPHRIELQLGNLRRLASFTILPQGGLRLSLASDRTVVIQGEAHRPLRVFVAGAPGFELLDVVLDADGVWRSPRALDQGEYRIVAQSEAAWNAIKVR